jgi:DNA-binding PadR family transcriptional regulator
VAAKHVLLGLLLDLPAYPYQMADRMEQRLGPAWQVNSGTLYRTVKELERDALIERVDKEPDDRAERHVFAITERGLAEFENWFEKKPDTVRLSCRPLLAKITFAGPDRLAQAMSKVEDYEGECAELLNEITGMREALPDTGEALLRANDMLLGLNLSTDIFALEGELRWAQKAREVLTWLSEQDRALWPSQATNGSAGDARKVGASARTQLFRRIAETAGDPEEHSDTTRKRKPAPRRAAG